MDHPSLDADVGLMFVHEAMIEISVPTLYITNLILYDTHQVVHVSRCLRTSRVLCTTSDTDETMFLARRRAYHE